MTALQHASTPRWTRWLSRFAIAFLVASPFVLLLTPWQQTVFGKGRAIAFNPIERPQYLVSPIEGRVKSWNVVEGQRVRRGERIAELVDNDPMLETRLEQERQALVDRRKAAASRIEQIQVAVSNLESSFAIQKTIQRNFMEIEQEQLTRTKQEEIDAQATLLAAEQNEKRTKDLLPKGGASERDVELAVRDLTQAKARLDSAKANIRLRTNSLTAANDLLERIEKDKLTAVSRESALGESAKSDLAAADAALIQIDVRIARQRAQYIDSPCDGVVHRLLANADQGGMLVRPGERLAMIVPDIQASLKDAADVGKGPPGIVAELWIDGNDLPLVRVGDQVRLQFEGWPAVQFAAFPEAAAGTFLGTVYLVDPAGNDRGQFRVLIQPAEPWPRPEYLRQGVHAQGWVVLNPATNRVSLGWELWRLLNGFPITRPVEPDSGGSRLGPVN